MTEERIQKVLARAGVASRRQVEQWVREGRVTVNGTKATLGTKIAARDRIALDGRPVRLHQAKIPAANTVVYHRSSGKSLKRTDDASSSELLTQLPGHASRRWIPISPLPLNDSGLELLTTDGDLAHAFTRHFSNVRTEYALRVFGDPRLDQLEHLKSGLLEDGQTLKVESLELEGGEGINRWFKLTAMGVGARDIHRLCSAADLQLSRLIRVRLGPVTMDRGLARGRVRPVEPQEIVELYALAGLPPPAAEPESVRPKKKSAPPRKPTPEAKKPPKKSPRTSSKKLPQKKPRPRSKHR